MNVYSRKLLGRIFCSFAGVEKAEYFQVGEEVKETPKVDFSSPSTSG